MAWDWHLRVLVWSGFLVALTFDWKRVFFSCSKEMVLFVFLLGVWVYVCVFKRGALFRIVPGDFQSTLGWIKALSNELWQFIPTPQWVISHHQLPHCTGGCRGLIGTVSVWLLTSAEGQKHPEVNRGCRPSLTYFHFKPYLKGVTYKPSYSFTKPDIYTYAHIHCKRICTASLKSED